MKFNGIFERTLVILSFVAVLACGSSSDTVDDTVTDAEQIEQGASFLNSSMDSVSDSLDTFASTSAQFIVITDEPLICTSGSGSFSLNTDTNPLTYSMSYDNCVMSTSTFDGGFDISYTEGTGTFSLTFTYDSFSVETSGGSISSSGSFSASGDTATNSVDVSFDELSGTFVIDGATITAVFDGDVSLDTSTNLLTGILTITTSSSSASISSLTITCDFTGGVDVTDSDAIEAACSL